MTHSPCNRILRDRQSSKTRAGMPCNGCTEPEYPHADFAPGVLPTGLDNIGYVKMMAVNKSAAPRWIENDFLSSEHGRSGLDKSGDHRVLLWELA
jgi:uptake hydrogenase small subunit